MSGLLRYISTVLIFAISVTLSAQADGLGEPLFKLKRSKNNREVHYFLNLTDEGIINASEPLVIVWAVDGIVDKTEPITWSQQRWGYGVRILSQATEQVDFFIVARPDRRIQVSKINGQYQARTIIGGRMACLKELYVAMELHNHWVPEVLYVDLIGVDPDQGRRLSERLTP